MTTIDDEHTDYTISSRKTIDDNSVIMMFTSSLVKHAASPQLRLPANFVGVQSVRQDFSKSSDRESKAGKDDRKGEISRLKASNDVKFCVVDENGNERRMTKAEKKAKKFQIAQAKKEAKKESTANKKRNFEQITVDGSNSENAAKSYITADTEAKTILQLPSDGATVASTSPYHQLPLDPTTLEHELAEFQGKRGSTPPVILSPPMALQFISKMRKPEKNTPFDDESDSALLVYDHNLSQEWANRLKEQCVLPAEAVREKEDLRPLAYRLQPEPWQRLRPSLEENIVVTWSRKSVCQARKSPLSMISSTSARKGKLSAYGINSNPRDWAPLTCRPRLISSLETKASIQHDDILSIIFEYIHRETPYYVSCGAKFGSDFLVYDGPRDKRHAFAGMRVLSRFTNSMTAMASKPAQAISSSEKENNCTESISSGNAVELPLPTAYSLTGFVRCLNTAGKLALLATVDEVSDSGDTNETKSSESSFVFETKRYRVAFVDVALEKVLDVHKRKNRGRSNKKKLQKRRDVTQTLSKI